MGAVERPRLKVTPNTLLLSQADNQRVLANREDFPASVILLIAIRI